MSEYNYIWISNVFQTIYVQDRNLARTRRMKLKYKSQTKNCDECPLTDNIVWDERTTPYTDDILCIYNPDRPVVLKETMRLMKKIDETIESHGGWPIK